MTTASQTLASSLSTATLNFTRVGGIVLQRKCANGTRTLIGSECADWAGNRFGLQRHLAIGASDDPMEQEADRVADRVLRAPAKDLVSDVPLRVERRTGESTREMDGTAAGVDRALTSGGRPLEPALRQDMEQRFGYDFSRVRVHADERAADSARALQAKAYTVGNHIVFGHSQYPARRLVAHELVHVIQQNAFSGSNPVVQRQYETGIDPDVVAEREYGGSGAPKAQKCGRPSWCPKGFCDPYRSEKLAEYYRAKNGGWIMAGISVAVDSRVVPFWREYLSGGSSPKDLSADFGADFTSSPTTKKTTGFLYDELKKSLTAKPPLLPLNLTTAVDIGAQIPTAVAAIDDPASRDQMNFNIPKDIPGNLAGGIGKDQLACPAGAKPSPFNDERKASGIVSVTRLSASELTVTPIISYTVKDTIDLCPGDCGTTLEQIATVPLSQFEATGISGDVPFTVNFAAPFLGQFKVTAPLAATPAPTSPPKKP